MDKPLTDNHTRYHNERIQEARHNHSAVRGHVHWSPLKSLWITTMMGGFVWGGATHFSLDALILFIVTSGITLCAGHSIGMHRKLIHNSFDCPQWLEKLLVYLGTLVGLGGPFTMTYTHDMRDWAQRQHDCHDYFAHRQSFFKDAWWQMHCDLKLKQPPRFSFDPKLTNSRFYRLIDNTAMWQQLPWAIIFFILGGWAWVFWGICARVSVSVVGHWLVGYFAHNRGGQRWHVQGATVQGYDVNFCGLITFGECWHNNHHAFPGSAKLGLYKHQFDPGWLAIKTLEKIGLASNIKTPHDLAPRRELIALQTANA